MLLSQREDTKINHTSQLQNEIHIKVVRHGTIMQIISLETEQEMENVIAYRRLKQR